MIEFSEFASKKKTFIFVLLIIFILGVIFAPFRNSFNNVKSIQYCKPFDWTTALSEKTWWPGGCFVWHQGHWQPHGWEHSASPFNTGKSGF